MASTSQPEVILYPAYIDAAKTCSGGRRIPKDKAVERPHAAEMYDAVTKGLCLDAKLEMTKSYSRDWLTRGRIRVALKRSDGAPVNTDIRTKLELLVKCAELCARHPHRAQRIEEQAKHEAMLFSGGAAQPKTKAAAGGDKGAAKAGKGGKKKGKKK